MTRETSLHKLWFLRRKSTLVSVLRRSPSSFSSSSSRKSCHGNSRDSVERRLEFSGFLRSSLHTFAFLFFFRSYILILCSVPVPALVRRHHKWCEHVNVRNINIFQTFSPNSGQKKQRERNLESVSAFFEPPERLLSDNRA